MPYIDDDMADVLPVEGEDIYAVKRKLDSNPSRDTLVKRLRALPPRTSSNQDTPAPQIVDTPMRSVPVQLSAGTPAVQ